MSDSCVSCTPPATQKKALQILFKCPTLANAFETATEPSRFAHLWGGAEFLAPATQNHISTFSQLPKVLQT